MQYYTFFCANIPLENTNRWHVGHEPTKFACRLGHQEPGKQEQPQKEIPGSSTYHGPPTVRRWSLLSRNLQEESSKLLPVPICPLLRKYNLLAESDDGVPRALAP